MGSFFLIESHNKNGYFRLSRYLKFVTGLSQSVKRLYKIVTRLSLGRHKVVSESKGVI